MSSAQQYEFRGTDRFAVLRRLGAGGMGAVYEAIDREVDQRVALKTLRRSDASLLYRLKTEFRALQDLHHPNLVRLGELIEERGQWFFTMELLDGVDFIAYVRSFPADRQPTAADIPRARRAVEEAHTLDVASGEAEMATPTSPPTPTPRQRTDPGELDVDRLRHALTGVVEGLTALHRAGLVHRDVKPSNILVTRDDRVVLLDFGLVQSGASRDEGRENLVGTPAYMAPEQALYSRLTAASDWYSVGVILYRALTGELPFVGSSLEVMMSKQKAAPPRPSALVSGLPEDLDALCVALMAPEPDERPGGDDVRRMLGGGGDEVTGQIPVLADVTSFVGRSGELAALDEAYAATCGGRPVAVYVHGRSGMGKTALVNRFLAPLRCSGDVVILTGRCYERETVPYKALDSLVDELSVYLKHLPRAEASSLMPRHVAALARIFPVLSQVEVIADAPWTLREADPHEVRARAFAALKELLGRIADRRPLVLFIDDLQWGDVDSAALLAELMRPPDAPSLLFLGSYRAEHASGPIVSALERIADAIELRHVAVGRMMAAELRQLAEHLADGDEARTDAIVRESEGSPFFAGELGRYLADTSRSETSADVSLEHVIRRRLEQLPEDVRRLLDVVCIVGRPIARGLAARAAGLDADGDAAYAYLHSAHMVRGEGTRPGDLIEPAHDRIRETVADALSQAQAQAIKARLANVFVQSEWAKSDMLDADVVAAADRALAFEYAAEAARRAEEALAFDRAAQLFELALSLADEADAPALRLELAHALEYAGRGVDASETYLAASDEVEGDERLRLRAKAAENLLRCGRLVAGVEHLDEVMRGLGARVPRTRRRAIVSLVFKRARLKVRGLGFRARAEEDVDPAELTRLDTLFSAASTLGMLDHLRGAALQTSHLLEALRVGEERRICRALVTETIFHAVGGPRAYRKAEALAREVTLQAERIGDPYLIGGAFMSQGSVAFFGGRFLPALKAYAEAERMWTDETLGTWWERSASRYFLYLAKINSGDLRGMARFVADNIAEAERRNDIFARNLYKAHPTLWCKLRINRPDEADAELDDALDGWPDDGYYQAHHVVMTSRVYAALYRGEAQRALELIDAARPGMRQLFISRRPFVMGEVNKLVGQAAVQLGDADLAHRAARGLSKIGISVGHAFSAALRSPLALARGDNEAAEELMAEAIANFEEAGSAHDVAAARYRLGKIIGGARGDQLMAEAVDWMREQGVVNPIRMIRFLCPVCPRR